MVRYNFICESEIDTTNDQLSMLNRYSQTTKFKILKKILVWTNELKYVSEYLEKCSNSWIRKFQILYKQDIISVDKLGNLMYFDWSATLYSHVEEKSSVYGEIEVCMLSILALLTLGKYHRGRGECKHEQRAQGCESNNDSPMENSKHFNYLSIPYK